jgi:hypothetical protein
MNRRDFIKTALAGGAALWLPDYLLAKTIDLSNVGTRILGGLERETKLYLSLPGVSKTGAEVEEINNYIRLIKYSSGITLASLTAKFSLVSPYLVTQVSSDIRWLSFLSGIVATWNDGTNPYSMIPGTVGTGAETYGSQIITGASAVSDPNGNEANGTTEFSASGTTSTFESTGSGSPYAGSYHFHIVGSTLPYAGFYKYCGEYPGKLMAFSFAGKKVTGANAAAVIQNAATTVTYASKLLTTSYIASVLYATGVSGQNFNIGMNVGNSTGELYGDNISLKQVLTPYIGFNFSAGSGASFNPNAASFSLTVARA